METLPCTSPAQMGITVLPSHILLISGIIRTLLKYPQSISPQNNAGNTPLHWACLNNHVETAKLLVTEGAQMFLKNKVGRDAVWEAEQRGNEELVSWLLSNGEERPVGQVTEGQEVELEGEDIIEGSDAANKE